MLTFWESCKCGGELKLDKKVSDEGLFHVCGICESCGNKVIDTYDVIYKGRSEQI